MRNVIRFRFTPISNLSKVIAQSSQSSHPPPVQANGQQGEHVQRDGQQRQEVVDLAEDCPEYPDSGDNCDNSLVSLDVISQEGI